MLSRLRAPLLVSLSALLVSFPLAASAGTFTHTDATGDIQRGWDAKTPAPRETFGDLQRWSARFGTHSVSIRIHARDLRRDVYAWPQILVQTPGRTFRINAGLGGSSSAELEDNSTSYVIDCPNFAWHVDFATNDMTARVPRACLDRADWVRVGLYFSRGFRDRDGTPYIDWDYGLGRAGSLELRYSPRIYPS